MNPKLIKIPPNVDLAIKAQILADIREIKKIYRNIIKKLRNVDVLYDQVGTRLDHIKQLQEETTNQ